MRAKKITLEIKLDNQTTTEIKAYQIGDYAYHKKYNSEGTAVTHAPSGIAIRTYATQRDARQQTIIFQQAPTWDGKGIPPKSFRTWLSNHSQDIYDRKICA